MRGNCPAGGVRVKGYATPAARYCVMTGGIYTATAERNTGRERGRCAFSNGVSCDAGDYFNGKCP